MADFGGDAIFAAVRFRSRTIGFWVFVLTGSAVLGFEPEQDGMEGIKQLVRARFPEVRQLQTAELADWLAATNRPRPVILDVREVKEFKVSHLKGAKQVTPGTKAPALRALLATNAPVVVYCSVGYRSSELARSLIKAGVTNVFNLEGSIFQWANEGRALVNARGPVAKVHPYSRRWSALLKPEARGEGD
jgi:rhodanese-related sulfurtransferase